MNRSQTRRRAKGLCGACGKVASESFSCPACKAKVAAYAKKRRSERAKLGLCVSCGGAGGEHRFPSCTKPKRVKPPTNTKLKITVGPLLFEFRTYEHWAWSAPQLFQKAGKRGEDCLCIDSKGRVCLFGEQFIRALDECTFPVRVFQTLLIDRPAAKDCQP